MQVLPVLLMTAALATETPVDVHLLDGGTQSGTLQHLSESEVELLVDGESVTLPAGTLQTLRFPEAAEIDAYTQSISIEVALVDGTRIFCSEILVSDRSATLTSDLLGDVTLPLSAVRSVRLGERDSKIDEDWRALHERESDNDLLVVRKEDSLDFAGGVVGEIGPETVSVLLGSRQLEVPRERVFGVVFPRDAPGGDAAAEIHTDAGDRLQMQSVELVDEQIAGSLVSGSRVSVPVGHVRLIDFAPGRVRYLSDMEATAVYEPVGLVTSEHVLRYRRVGAENDPQYNRLAIGQETFARGLWIHSGTVLRYRLNRDFTRLEGILGINRSSYNCARFNPSVHVQIIADGEVRFDEVVSWEDDPHALELNVADVRDLEIRVETAAEQPLGICEHLAFAEARVVK